MNYRVFGLRVRSELPLPELVAADDPGSPDVTIRLASLGRPGAPAGLHPDDDDGLLLIIDGVAQFRIRGGNEIIVDSVRDVPERNVRLYLLGSVFGVLLHQRGLLPLHANAIEIDGRAVAFMGESGAGKSTLAAWFHDQGYKVIADDVCVVDFREQHHPKVLPGLPRLRLWEEALQAFGHDPSYLSRAYVGDSDWNKYDLPLTLELDRPELDLAAVYVLERGTTFGVETLTGIEAADAVFAHTYRGEFVAAAKNERRHWSTVTRLVQHMGVHRLSRVWGLGRMDDQGGLMLRHIEAIGPAPDAIATDRRTF
jgi:hypothetical protein